MSERLAQRVALLSQIDPMGVLASSTTTGDVIDASLYDSLMFILSLGTITSSGKLTMTIYKGTVAAAASITSSVTSVTFTEKDDDKQHVIDVDVSNELSNRYYKMTLVANGGTTTGACFASAIALGSKARFHPASDNDLSTATVTLA